MIQLSNITYGVAMQTVAGEIECGDQYLIKKMPGAALIAVADGLGHGEEAALAAKQAMHLLAASQQTSLMVLIQACHEALKKTRGAVMALMLIDNKNTVSWISIGNVLGVRWLQDDQKKTHSTLFNNLSGVVGMRLPSLKLSNFTASPGDTFILTTDGIRPDFVQLKPMPHALPQTIAQHIFNHYCHQQDDALVVVVRLPRLDSGRQYDE